MNHKTWIVLGALCLSAPLAHAQDQGGPLSLPVKLDLRNAQVDEQLIQLARTAKVNIMADASDEPDENVAPKPAGDTRLSVEKTQSLLEWMLDISYANGLSWQRRDNTMVMWRKPETVSLARRITEKALAQRPQLEAEVKPPLRTVLNPELVSRLDDEPNKWSHTIEQHGLYGIVLTRSLVNMLKEKHGWDGQSQEFQIQLQGEQIPTDLRDQIILYRRQVQARSNPNLYAWLHPKTWQNARLFVQKTPPMITNGKPDSLRWHLNIESPVEGTGRAKTVTRNVATLLTEGGAQ